MGEHQVMTSVLWGIAQLYTYLWVCVGLFTSGWNLQP